MSFIITSWLYTLPVSGCTLQCNSHRLLSDLHQPTCAGVYAAARALLTVYGQLLDKGELDEDQFKLLASFDEFNSLVRLEERLALEERYGRGDGMEKLTVR